MNLTEGAEYCAYQGMELARIENNTEATAVEVSLKGLYAKFGHTYVRLNSLIDPYSQSYVDMSGTSSPYIDGSFTRTSQSHDCIVIAIKRGSYSWRSQDCT